ncbi:MAG TPA: glycoside hydrolase family 31 protein [Niabella sp.]|nr:glycoside hydrolase family 31 protein [Niabella sp.]
MRLLVLHTVWMFFACPLLLQGQVKNTGKIISYERLSSGISGNTEMTLFEVRAVSNNIIRVRVSKEKVLSDFSYVLTAKETPVNVTVEEKDDVIYMATRDILVEVEKRPSFRVTFRNRAGEILNEDVTGEAFGTTFIGNKVSIYKKMQEGERFVGMGEALGNLDRRGTGITLNNTDTYKYEDPRLPMYVSVPFYIGIHHKRQYGIFYNNTYKSFFNFGLSTPGFTSVNMEGGDADYFFIYDESVGKIIGHYTSLTGRIQLPPLWGIGYHQSRCSYYPQQKVEWIAETFRQKQIPLDCIVLDADYQQDYQPFRVNKERFPDMLALAASLAKKQVELTASVYPGVAIDSAYHSYVDGLKNDVFIKYADGSLFETEISPVKCYLPDYTNPKTRTWWKGKMKWLPDNGIHGYWNDMNEPAIGGSYLPDNLLFDFEGKKANALEAKNLYGFLMARSSYEAALQNTANRRPFVLTRSGFAGVQRYAAVWSGDNTANDAGLLSSVLLNNQLGLSGIPFCGHDIGGFIGNGSGDLFVRWMQIGVFSPFCRNHKGCGGPAAEPWVYGDEIEAVSKTFIGFRYRLMPYLYAAFYEASQTGMPVARSLCINYPFDDKVYDSNYQYQFLFGGDMMVVPVTSAERSKKIYLPKGDWYNIYTGEKITGEQEQEKVVPVHQLPIYIKASAIIPMQSGIQSTKEKPADTLFVHVFNGKEKNVFTYYEDDGETLQYQEGEYYKRQIIFDPLKKQITLQSAEGRHRSHFKQLQVIFHGFDGLSATVKVNNRPVQLADSQAKILNSLENLGGVYERSHYNNLLKTEVQAKQKAITVANATGPVIIQL